MLSCCGALKPIECEAATMADCVQHSLQTTRNNRGVKKGTRAAQRQWSSAERCTVHSAWHVCGLRSYTAHSSWEVSWGCRSLPNCSTIRKVLMLRRCPGENTAQILSAQGKVQLKQHSQNAQTRMHAPVLAGTSPGSRGGKLILPCAAVYHPNPIPSSPEGSLRMVLFCPPFAVWPSRVVDGDSLNLQLTYSPTTG